MQRRLIAFACVWIPIGGLTIAACGDDDATPPPSAPDAAVDTAAPPVVTDGSTTSPPTIRVSDLDVYVGMTARPDASSTNAGAFQWRLKSAPKGSALTDATLAGASTPRPSFRADVSGDYVLELVAKNGSATSTKDVKVKATAAPLFYIQTSGDNGPSYYEHRTVRTDGTDGHAIACRVKADADGGNDQVFAALGASLADVGVDWWEAPAGLPARVAFAQLDIDDGGTGDPKGSLRLGTNASTCQTAAATVFPVPEDGGGGGGAAGIGEAIIQPRFSRNGERVAYLELRGSGWFLATVGADGKGRRDLSRLCAEGVSSEGCFTPWSVPPRPQWLDDQNVAWVRTNASGWEIVVAKDDASTTPRVFMTCDGATPRSFAFLAGGKVVANREAPDAGREDLWLLEPASAGGACKAIKNLTNLPTVGSYARDFAIAPDESTIAFLRRDHPADAAPPQAGDMRYGGLVYTVAASGASAPAPVGGPANDALFGPRWVAGGSTLAWNGVVAGAGTGVSFVDGGLPVIAVAPAEGGAVTYAVRSDPDAGVVAMGGGNGGSCDFRMCAIGRTQASGYGAIAFGAFATAFALRRRRR